MISQTATLDVETSGNFKRHEFKIKATAKAFKALSADIYKNKIRAIVREYSTNAHDSHVFNGNPHEPFDVKLPSLLDPNFVIRDYGIGLSYKEIVEIYTTYFESTKDNSNDYNGVFGVGAKSGFAYTDKFDLHSYKDGVKTSYSLFINQAGVPECAKLVSTKTTERNGVEISIPVNRQDFEAFKKEAELVYAFFAVQPNVTGNAYYKKPQRTKAATMEEKGKWEVYDSPNGIDLFNESRVIAQMGNVAYPVRLNNLGINLYNHFLLNDYNTYIVLHVDIGDVDIVLSREELDYIPHTVNSLKKKIEVIEKSYQKKLEAELDQCVSYWDACIKYFNQPLHIANVAYKNKIIKKSVANPLYDSKIAQDGGPQDVLYMPAGYSKIKVYHVTDIACSKNVKFYLDDLSGKGSHTRINHDIYSHHKSAYIIKTTDPKKIKKLVDAVGILEKDIIKASSLPVPPKKAKGPSTPRVAGYRLKTQKSTSLTYNWERLNAVPAGSLVVGFQNMYLLDAKDILHRPEYLQEMLKNIPKSFKIDPEQVYALSDKKFKAAKSSGFKLFWEEFFDALDTELKANKSKYETLLEYQAIFNLYSGGNIYNSKKFPNLDDFFNNLKAICPIVNNKFLNNIQKMVEDAQALQQNADTQKVINLVNLTKRTTLSPANVLTPAVQAIYDKAPLLKQINWYNHSGWDKKKVDISKDVAIYLKAVL